MADHDQVKKIKCPTCGWIRSVPVAAIVDASETDVVKGPLSDAVKDMVKKIQAALADSQLAEANAWIDLPKCPHCDNTYQYNVRTGETRR